MATTFILRKDVDFSLTLGVRSDRTWLSENLTALDSFLVDTAKKDTNVVACLTLVEHLAEHFYASNRGLLSVLEANDFDFFANLDHTTLDTSSSNRTTTSDREYVFYRHEEWLINFTLWLWNIVIDCFHKLLDTSLTVVSTFESLKSRTANDSGTVAVEVVLVEKFANFHFNELEKLFVVDEVALVEENNDLRYTYLTSEKDVLASLRHRTVRSGTYEDRAVHLSSASDHVLYEVRVTWAVNVCVVTLVGLVLNVSNRDRYNLSLVTNRTTLCDVGVALDFSKALAGLNCQDGSGQRSFAVVNVTDRADINVWFRSFEGSFSHFCL